MNRSRLDSAPSVGVTLLTGLIDLNTHFGKAKPAVLIPGPGSKCLDEIYAKYLDRTACDATHP